MPLGKYYCDYCEKEFQDTPTARKRHLQGIQHLRAKASWYDSFQIQDPNQGFGKGVCNRFVKTGFCQYGDSCKYFHPKNLPNAIPQGQGGQVDNSMQSAVATISGQLISGGLNEGNMIQDGMGTSWGNLPPSLKPPPEGGYPHLPFVDWG